METLELNDKDILNTLYEKECLDHFDLVFANLYARNETQSVRLLVAILSYVSRLGHLCIKFHDKILPSINSLWRKKCTDEDLQQIEALLYDGFQNLPKFLFDGPKSPFYKLTLSTKSSLYLRRNWNYETLIIEGWEKLKSNAISPAFCKESIQKKIEQSTLNELQKKAVLRMFLNSVTCLTGGPGTGKTFTASFFIQLFLKESSNENITVVLAAPTGKATQRLHESVLKNVSDKRIIPKTLHSLLKRFNPYQAWKFDPYLLLEGDLFIIDEASMIDAALMAQLFQSIPPSARLILLGDPFQLPAVENGALFADLIVREKMLSQSVVVALEESVRIENPHIRIFSKVLKESPLKALELLASIKTDAFQTHFLSQFNEWKQFIDLWIKENLLLDDYEETLTKEKIDIFFSFYQKKVLLTPLRKGIFGVIELNLYIQKKYRELRKGKRLIEPILITSSLVKENLTNGDFGLLICDNQNEKNDSYALFPEMKNYRKIPSSLLPSFERAFALSIHKSQGSEYNHVDLLIPEGSEVFSKEIFYTAVTRAKKSLALIAHPETFKLLLEKDVRRISGLCERNAQES